MRIAFRILVLLAIMASAGSAGGLDVATSTEAADDVEISANPASAFWRAARPIFAERDKNGRPLPGYRSEVRSRWTGKNLYFLFSCPYEQLFLKPNPSTTTETNALWNWDVAEVFLGSDFQDIKRYKEFELSPQGEWIDLDVDLHKPHHEDGWTWNSGFEVSARIDRRARIWYGAMRIPYSAIDHRPAAPGNALRMNLFRSQGPASHRQEITWQAPMSNTFHVPERFGLLKLVRKEQ